MTGQRELEAAFRYELDEDDGIRPIHQMGWVKEAWISAPTLATALEQIAAMVVESEDMFPSADWTGPSDELLVELRAKHHLGIEEGFYLATGVDVTGAVFRFRWQERILFNMRPDFGFRLLATNLDEPPINVVESAVRDRLIDYYRQTAALKAAFDAWEIQPTDLQDMKWWRSFWQVRGCLPEPTAAKPSSEEESISPKSRRTLLRLIAALCVEAKVDPANRGAAATVAAITHRAGVPVGDDTIKKVLDELPEVKRDR